MHEPPATRFEEAWAPACVTLAVCLFTLTERPLWFDEHASWWAATVPWPVLWKLLAQVDAVIAPYYLLLKGWIALFGDSAAALRLPSTLVMTVCAALVGCLGKKLFDRPTGLVAGLAFATLPSVTRYGQEARPYAFVMTFSALATLLLLRAADNPEKAGRWAAYGLALFGVGLFHLPALSILTAHALVHVRPRGAGPWWKPRLETLRPWLLATLTTLLAISPLIWLGRKQADQIAWNSPDFAAAFVFPTQFLLARRLSFVVMALALLALVVRAPHRAMLGCWALLPVLLFFVTRQSLHLFHPRYLLFTLPAWMLLAALGVKSLGRLLRAPRAMAAAGALVFVVMGLSSKSRVHWLWPWAEHSAAAEWIRSERRPQDAIAFGGPERILRHARLAMLYELRPRPPRDIFAELTPLEAANFVAHDCPLAAACLSPDVKRLWLVTSSPPYDLWHDLPQERAQTIRSAFEVADYRRQRKANVYLLERKQ